MRCLGGRLFLLFVCGINIISLVGPDIYSRQKLRVSLVDNFYFIDHIFLSG